jgi:hypothetical protein
MKKVSRKYLTVLYSQVAPSILFVVDVISSKVTINMKVSEAPYFAASKIQTVEK